MMQNAVYSVISPEGCASILWKDSAKADEAAASLKLTAEDAYRFGIVEHILNEAEIGQPIFYKKLKDKIIKELDMLASDENLIENRYNRFRRIGRYSCNPEGKDETTWASTKNIVKK